MKKNIISLLFVSFILLISACDQSGNAPAQNNEADSDTNPSLEIDADSDGFSSTLDCDDNNPLVNSLSTFYIDNDNDGFGSVNAVEVCALTPASGESLTNNDPDDDNSSITPLDQDGDGTPGAFDCNDEDSTIALTVNYFEDIDSDGFGAGSALSICSNQPPEGYVLSNADPDDNNSLIIPDDLDGDGIANTDDCAPDDDQRYISQVYYDDSDGDNIGAGDPVNECVAMPLPVLDNLSLITGDSCPDNFNSGRDFDEDNIDDVCDLEIRVISDKVISGNDNIDFTGSFDGSRRIVFGAQDKPVTVEFKDSSRLSLSNHALLYLEGGSKLIFNKSLHDETPVFSAGNDSGLDGRVRIIGVGENNRIEFNGANLFLGLNVEFDGLETILVTTQQVFNPVENRNLIYASKILYFFGRFSTSNINGIRYVIRADEAPTIKNSSGKWALHIVNQSFDVSPVRFLDNRGYPLKCSGDDLFIAENKDAIRSTSQTAIYSRYEGNLFNGPLLAISYTNKSPQTGFRYERNLDLVDTGTNELHIESFSLQITDDIARLVTFENIAFKARHNIAKEADGTITDFGFPQQANTIPFFRVFNTGFSLLAQISFSNSDVREVPLIIDGGQFHVFGSQASTVLFPNNSGQVINGGQFIANSASTLDFVNSPYVISDGVNYYGIGLRKTSGAIILGNNIGDNPVNTEDEIVSGPDIRYPIISLDPISLQTPLPSELISTNDGRIRVTKSVALNGADVETLVGQDDAVNALFLQKR